MEKHLREMEHYRAFFVGQRDKNPGADEGMPQYVGEWERRWEQLSDGKNTKGSLRFIHCYGQLGIHLLTTHREAEALGVIVARPGVWLDGPFTRDMFMYLLTVLLVYESLLNVSSCLTAARISNSIATIMMSSSGCFDLISSVSLFTMATLFVTSPEISILARL